MLLQKNPDNRPKIEEIVKVKEVKDLFISLIKNSFLIVDLTSAVNEMIAILNSDKKKEEAKGKFFDQSEHKTLQEEKASLLKT